jgi:MATE family multidrug resistance protein
MSMGVVVLRFVAAYLLLDGLYMISTAVLKGAGDTKFIMWSIGLLSFLGMVIPLYIGMEVFGLGLYFAWSCMVLFIFLLAAITFGRFRLGQWKNMRVIEQSLSGQGTGLEEGPV